MGGDRDNNNILSCPYKITKTAKNMSSSRNVLMIWLMFIATLTFLVIYIYVNISSGNYE